MPNYCTGSATAPQQRLAELLTDMVPGARTLRVSQREPSLSWPSPDARAYDAQGKPLTPNRTLRLTAARWVMRAFPGLDWDEPYDFDLTTGELQPASTTQAVAAGGC